MGKFKHDGSSVDTSRSGGGYSGEQPKNGIYEAKLVTCEEHVSQAGQEGTHWVFEITDGDFEGWRGHVYTNDAGALWKQDQVLVALGLQEPGGSYEGTHETIVKKSGPVRIKTRSEVYEEERRAKIATVLPPAEGQKASAKAEKGKKKKADAEPF